MHVTGRIVAGIVTFVAVVAVVALLSAEYLLNGFVRERILQGVNSREGTSLSLGTFRYSVFTSRITCDSLRLSLAGDRDADDSIGLTVGLISCSGINWFRVLFGQGFSCSEIGIEGLRGRIASGSAERGAQGKTAGPAEPKEADASARLLPFSTGRLLLRGGGLERVMGSRTGVVHDSISRFSVDVNGFRLDSASANQLGLALARARIESVLEGGRLGVPGSKHNLGFGAVRISSQASSLRADSLEFAPPMSDADFFANDRTGATRIRASIERVEAHGVDFEGLLRGDHYTSQRIVVSRPAVNITVNMRVGASGENPMPGDTSKMPNEILTGMRETIRIDSLLVRGGTIEYAELYPYSASPALLKWSGVRLAATSISNGKGTSDSVAARFVASGLFQDTAHMLVSMTLPLASPDFSLVCHGVVDSLPLPSLNSFLEVAERIRVLSGKADSIKFSLTAAHGRSTGLVRPLYRDLKIEMLEKESGGSDKLPQKLETLLARILKIRNENVPKGSEAAREGPVRYVRRVDDPFFRFVWFSLRGGLGSVVGF